MAARASLGQHFLVNRPLAVRIVHALPTDATTILEIGPGKGILTAQMLEQHPHATITAVERDPQLFLELQQRFPERLNLIHADILEIDLHTTFPCHPIDLLSNVPYYLSKKLIDWIILQRQSIRRAVLLLQREFAQKLNPGRYPSLINPQGILLNHLFRVSEHFIVQPGSFSPPPKVVSTLVALEKIEPVPEIDITDFYGFLKKCFASRRKTLSNNLKNFESPVRIKKILSKRHFPVSARADELPASSFFAIYHHCRELGSP